jgi:hypothetical protein
MRKPCQMGGREGREPENPEIRFVFPGAPKSLSEFIAGYSAFF